MAWLLTFEFEKQRVHTDRWNKSMEMLIRSYLMLSLVQT